MIKRDPFLHDDMRLVDLTVGEFKQIINDALRRFEESVADAATKPDQYVHGFRALSEALGMSTTTLQRLRRDGTLNGTFSQSQRTIIFNLNKVQRKLAKA